MASELPNHEELRAEVARLQRELAEALAARTEAGPDITTPTAEQRDLEGLARFPADNPNPNIRVAGDGQILYANAAAKALLSHFNRGTHDVLPGPWRQVAADAIQAGHTAEIQIPHDGRVFSFVIVPIRGTGYANWYGHDVTRLKRAEEALREEHANLWAIMSASPVGIFVLDQQQQIVAANAAAERMLQKKPEEWKQQRGGDLLACINRHEDPRGCGYSSHCPSCALLAAANRALANRQGTRDQDIEVLRDLPEGPGRSWFTFSVEPVTLSGQTHAVVALADIAPRKQAEEALRDSEERYRSLVNLSPDAIYVVCQNKLVLINEAGLRLFGATGPEQMLGKSPFDFVHPDYHAVVAEHIRRMLELGEAAPLIEMRIFRLDGALRTVDAAGATIMYQGVLSVQAVLRDVTAQKEAEGRLRRREAELAHLSRLHTIGEMTAALAHELNQPLQAINNYVRGAQRRLKNPGAAADLAPIVDAMERVSREVGRAADIVTHLRDFIQGREPHRSSVDVAALLQQAVALLQAVARDKDVAVELQPVADLPAVHADAIQVEQVVVNLVTNAVDAAAGLPPPRRKVTIAARRAESAAAEGGGAEGGAVEIAVRDCGRGVPENLKDKLFEPFVTTKENGLGFGLAISRSIVESHGGKIWVVHQEPHGVAFHFTLLLAAVREEP